MAIATAATDLSSSTEEASGTPVVNGEHTAAASNGSESPQCALAGVRGGIAAQATDSADSSILTSSPGTGRADASLLAGVASEGLASSGACTTSTSSVEGEERCPAEKCPSLDGGDADVDSSAASLSAAHDSSSGGADSASG